MSKDEFNLMEKILQHELHNSGRGKHIVVLSRHYYASERT